MQELKALVAAQPQDFTVGWSFAGTAHFIGQAPALSAYRDGLLTLVKAMEGADRSAISAALGNAEASLRPQP